MEAVVRRVGREEGALLKSVRLSALADSPAAFGSSYAAKAEQPDDHWRDRARLGAAGQSSVTFFAIVGESVVGLVSAYRPDPAELSAELVSMWMSPTHRGEGVATALVTAVVDWAHQSGMATLELWVTRGNDAAVGLYETVGFRPTGDYQPLPSDPCKDELRMRLSLD